MYSLLILSFVTLFAGPVLYRFAKKDRFALEFLDAFVLFSILGLVAFHVLPESIAEGGTFAIVAAALGLFGPLLAGKLLGFGHCHMHPSIVSMATLGLLAHAILDGAALSGASSHMGQHTESFFLGLAVVLHRLPEGIGIWRVTQSRWGGKASVLAFTAVAATTLFGFFFGHQVLTHASEQALVTFQAFMAGALLHVIFHRHDAHEDVPHKAQRRKWRLGSSIGAATGVAAILILTVIHPSEHSHGHHHHSVIETSKDSTSTKLLSLDRLGNIDSDYRIG